MGKSIIEEIGGEKGSRASVRLRRKRIAFACAAIVFAAVVLSFFDQSLTSANEQYIRNEMPGYAEEDPPRSVEEHYFRYESGFIPHGPREKDKYPNMDKLKRKPAWWWD